MSKPTNTNYAYVRIEGRRFADLPRLAAHNDRAVWVPNAAPSVQNWSEVPWASYTPDCAEKAVRDRLASLGVDEPSAYMHVAYEAMFTLSAEAENPPTMEHFMSVTRDFVVETWGSDSLVGMWGHADEKTMHAHVYGIPLVEGFKPGRPKRGEGPRKAQLVVSWNQFSGSNKVKYRRLHGPKKKLLKTAPNERFIQLQTDWAAKWVDRGYRRGIYSGRKNRSPSWIRGKTEAIHDMAEAAKKDVLEPAKWLALSFNEVAALRDHPTLHTMNQIIATHLPGALNKLLGPLTELAKRGEQLPLEKEARALLGYRLAKVEKGAEETSAALVDVRAENALLKDKMDSMEVELATLRMVAAKPVIDQFADHLADLSETDFQALAEARKRVICARKSVAPNGGIKALPPGPKVAPKLPWPSFD